VSWEPEVAKRRQGALEALPKPTEEEAEGVRLWALHGDISGLPDRFMNPVLWWERADTCLENFHRLAEEAKQE
jgi:hypothetical protein